MATTENIRFWHLLFQEIRQLRKLLGHLLVRRVHRLDHVVRVVAVVSREVGQADALFIPAGPSDAVDVGLEVVRDIVDHDQFDVTHIFKSAFLNFCLLHKNGDTWFLTEKVY